MLLPSPYPDEIFYGVIARFADRMGLRTGPAVAKLAFGLNRIRSTTEIPPRLHKLLPRLLPHSPYTADALIADHSSVPYFTAFMDDDRARAARDAVLADDGVAAFARLGINTVRGRPTLLFCDACVAADRQSGREPYWRRCHNLPGVCMCLQHGSLLREGISVRGDENVGFVSIERMLAENMPTRVVAVTTAPEMIRAVSAASVALLNRPDALRGGNLVPAFFARLHAAGWKHGKHLASTKLMAAVSARLGPDVLAEIGVHHPHYSNNTAPRLRGRSTDWLGACLRVRGSVTHPLPYILVLTALDVPTAGLLDGPVADVAAEPSILEGPCGNAVCPAFDPPVPRPLEGITGEGKFTIRCPTCGFTHRQASGATRRFERRIVEFGPLWDEALRRECESGDATKQELKARLGFDIYIIKRRALDLGIWHSRWGERTRTTARERNGRGWIAKREDSRDRYRARWIDMAARSPGAGRSEIGRLDQNVYEFLRTYDADWLDKVTPRVRAQRAGQARDDANDAALAALIVEAAEDIRTVLPPKRVTRAAIARALGLTKLRLDADRLPESVSVLTGSAETAVLFAARRRQWSDGEESASGAVRPTEESRWGEGRTAP